MSDWVNFVKMFADENDLSYGDALKVAGPYYKQGHQMRRPQRNNRRLEDELYGMGLRLGQIFQGGADQPKGALAALLSGLNAHISVE